MSKLRFTFPGPSKSGESPPIFPGVGIFIGVLAASTASIFIRFAQRDAPSLVIAAYRLDIATLLLIPVLRIRFSNEYTSLTRRERVYCLISGVFLAIHFATWIRSLEFTSVASSVVLVQTAPIFVALLSPLVLNERPGGYFLLGLGLCMAGSVLVGLSDVCSFSGRLICPGMSEFIQGAAIRGDILALLGALGATGYLLVGRKLRGSVPLIPYITLAYGTAGVLLTFAALFQGQPLVGYPPRAYLFFFLLAAIPQLIAHSSYNWALRYLPAALVSITWLGEPVGSTILAYYILAETPPALRFGGGLLILLGITLAARRQRSASTAETQNGRS
jgi:drug/metabolite transporter (DMT)-like permease